MPTYPKPSYRMRRWYLRQPHLLPQPSVSFTAALGVHAQVTFSYPDDIPPKRGMRTAAQQFLAFPVRGSVLPPAVTTWYPVYPPVLFRARRIIPQQDFPPPQSFPVIVPLSIWRPVHPDWIARRRIAPASMLVSVLAGHPSLPVLVEWLPEYPDLHWTVGLKAPFHQVFAQNLDPIPNPPSPDLAWGPSYPDQVWPLAALRAGLQQVWTDDPQIMPPSPDLAWQPRYPAYLWRRSLTAERHPAFSYIERVANIAPDLRMDWRSEQTPPVRSRRHVEGMHSRPVEVPVSPVVFLPDRQDPPDVPFRRPAFLGGEIAAPIGAALTTALQLGWASYAPVLARVVARGLDLPVSVAPLLPPGPDTWCIRLAQEAIIPTQLDDDQLLLPSFAEETVLSPQLAAEENC